MMSPWVPHSFAPLRLHLSLLPTPQLALPADAGGLGCSYGIAEAMLFHGLIDGLRRSETAGSDCQRLRIIL
jgi:hypothetical protein